MLPLPSVQHADFPLDATLVDTDCVTESVRAHERPFKGLTFHGIEEGMRFSCTPRELALQIQLLAKEKGIGLLIHSKTRSRLSITCEHFGLYEPSGARRLRVSKKLGCPFILNVGVCEKGAEVRSSTLFHGESCPYSRMLSVFMTGTLSTSITSKEEQELSELFASGMTVPVATRLIARRRGPLDDLSMLKLRRDLVALRRRNLRASVLIPNVDQTVEFLQQNSEKDPSFFYRTHLEDGQLSALFICFGEGRKRAEMFSDSLAIDTLHNTNTWGFVATVCVGIDGDGKVYVAFVCLQSVSTEEEFRWGLTIFRDNILQGISPDLIMTDGERALREAVQTVFPASMNGLCQYHLLQNVVKKLRGTQLKVSEILHVFCKAMKSYSQQEFNEWWKQLDCLIGTQCIESEPSVDPNDIQTVHSYFVFYKNVLGCLLDCQSLARRNDDH